MRTRETIKKLKSNKAFTLIELIVVIAILGILVLLAAPKFLGYTADANDKKIANDIRVYENEIEALYAKESSLENKLEKIPQEKIEELNNSGKVKDKKGEVVSNLSGEVYFIGRGIAKSKLPGEFILSEDYQVYYYDENEKPSEVNDSNSQGNTTEGENKDPEVSIEDDFEWFESFKGYYTAENPTTRGYYKYMGDDETVVIPNTIKGTEMTSYYGMFEDSSTVKKVISTNTNVTSTRAMFMNSTSPILDLSELNTSNVDDMAEMFKGSSSTVDLTKMNYSKVENTMYMFQDYKDSIINFHNVEFPSLKTAQYMFSNSEVSDLNFNITAPNLKDVSYMFEGVELTVLGLSTINFSTVVTVDYMLKDSTINSIYVATTADKTKITNSLGNPKNSIIQLENIVNTN